MNKYIIVYEGYSSFYNEYSGSTVTNTGLNNYELEASSKKEAYEKFQEYAKKKQEEARHNSYYRNLQKYFTILNIIELKDENE